MFVGVVATGEGLAVVGFGFGTAGDEDVGGVGSGIGFVVGGAVFADMLGWGETRR